jgi:hypothetical protein
MKIEIDFGVDRTKHAEERQGRHDSYISNEEITQNVEAALQDVITNLIFDKSNIGERLLIKNIDSKLNIVGVPLKTNDDILIFRLITVMRHEEFRNVMGTKIIEITDKQLKHNRNFFKNIFKK